MKKTTSRLLLLITLFLTSHLAFTQDEFESRYTQGKDLYNRGKYAAAMEVFKPLTSEQEGNSYVQYSEYFYALSAFKAGQYNEAKNMLLQLTNNYSDWEKIGEAYYLLGLVSFEQNKFRMGLKYFQELKDRKKDFKEDAEKAKAFYMEKVTPLDTLINLQRDFPTDPAIARVLFRKLSALPAPSEKQNMLMEYLAQEFKLERRKPGSEKQSEMKSAYNVAVMLPFLLNEPNNSSAYRSHQYVYDLYEGIKMSADSLKKAGITINLFAYDTEKDEDKVRQVLNLPELKSMDMIIGPVFPAQYAEVNDFGMKNKILVVNPLSANHNLIEGNPFLYLFQPVMYNYAGMASDYADKHFIKEEKVKNVLILQSPTTRDSLLSISYRDSIITKGFQVKNLEVISKDNMKRVQELLRDSLLLTTVSHIFVATSDQVLAANIVSALEISQFKVPMFATSDWLHFPLLTYDQYERREVHFLYPDFIDFNRPAVPQFRRSFYARMNTLPHSSYSYQGYELMRLFGRMMGKYGNWPVAGMQKEGFVPGYLMTGFNYSYGQSNSFIPIVKFTDSSLELLNYPRK